MRQARHLLFGLAVIGVVAGLSSPARADFNIATGLKWVPLRYTHPVAATGGPANSFNAADIYGWQSTSLDNYLAFYFVEQFGIQLSLDFGYGSFHNDIQSNGPTQNDDESYTQFGVAVGGKFYFNRPARERVSPYLYFDFYKYFASISSSRQIPNDYVAAVAGLHSPLGFNVAFGAEYFFTTSFSLGAEVLGIRYAYVEGDWADNAARYTRKEQYLTLYTAITLNYRFLATASVHTYEDEEDRANPRPVRRRPAPRPRQEEPPPDAPPPPSPESVD